MKSLLKIVALLVIAMPLFAFGEAAPAANGAAAPMMDCSKMMGADKDKCMADMDKCMKMTDMAAKDKCMADMKAAPVAAPEVVPAY